MARRNRKAQTQPQPTGTRPGSLAVNGAAAGYVAVCVLLVLSKGSTEQIGAVCGGNCAAAGIAGIPLELFGIALMACAVGCFHGWRLTNRQPLAAAAGTLAILHFGASLSFAASQWIGAAPLCPFCQLAMIISGVLAALMLRPLREAFGPIAVYPGALAGIAGILTVPVAWPYIQTEGGDPAPIVVDQEAEPETPAQHDVTRDLVDALVIGDPEAPYELIVLSDLNCKVCKRFEDRTLPDLLEQGVAPGHMRIRFLITASAGTTPSAEYQLTAATAAAMAGMPVPEVLALIGNRTLRSTPQGVHLIEDSELKDQALSIVHEFATDPGWPAVRNQHARLSLALREKYFNNSTATPLFVMIKGPLDLENLPPEEEVYTFKGYNIAKPYLEFAGVE